MAVIRFEPMLAQANRLMGEHCIKHTLNAMILVISPTGFTYNVNSSGPSIGPCGTPKGKTSGPTVHQQFLSFDIFGAGKGLSTYEQHR